MGLEKVKKGLEKELEDKSSEILDEAKEEKKRIISEAKDEVRKLIEASEEKAEKEIKSLKSSEMASAKLGVKKELLSRKKELVDEVFDEVEEELEKMSKSKRKKIIKNLVSQAESEIDIGKILCNPKDKELVEKYKVETSESIKGGVICESKDGSCSVDLTYDTLLSEVREANVREVAETLFE